jgi:hypothetical protein
MLPGAAVTRTEYTVPTQEGDDDLLVGGYMKTALVVLLADPSFWLEVLCSPVELRSSQQNDYLLSREDFISR